MDGTLVWKSFQLGMKKSAKIPALLIGSYHVAFIHETELASFVQPVFH